MTENMDFMETVESDEVEIVSDLETIKKMSLVEVNNTKKALEAQRTRAMLATDERKLREIEGINAIADSAIAALCNEKFWTKIVAEGGTYQDLKFATESLYKLMEIREKLFRLDTIDGNGTARKVSIGVRFDDGNGTKVDTIVKVGE